MSGRDEELTGREPVAAVPVARVVLASFIGTTIEWYDFFLYGTASALVFNRLFFPTFDPWTGTMAAFATYAVGFFARPVGGVVFGHFGDRLGRKSMLVTTLMLMGVATFLIGLLPTYDQIGAAAPALLVLLRFIQGFGVGGEWGGAVLMAVEHGHRGRRGLYGSWVQAGVPAGLLLATAVFSLFSRMPEVMFLSWGWRVPFLLGIVLLGVGMFIRLQVLESPLFAKLRAARPAAKAPFFDVLRRYPRNIVLAMGARFAENGCFYIFTVFVLTYATEQLGLDKSLILNAVLFASGLQLGLIPLFGLLSDRLGRRPVYLSGAAALAAFAVPYFMLLDTRSTPAIFLATVIALVIHSAMYAPQGAFFSELFGTDVRYSGASIGYQLASPLAGGAGAADCGGVIEVERRPCVAGGGLPDRAGGRHNALRLAGGRDAPRRAGRVLIDTDAHRSRCMFDRRAFLAAGGSLLVPWAVREGWSAEGAAPVNAGGDLTITSLKVTPIALPDPPILAASGCHGPYFLRNIVEIGTAEGITGIGETHGGAERTEALEKCREIVVGKSAFAYRALAGEVLEHGARTWAGIELACLDAVGRALGVSLSRLLGGPVRDEVEFSSYLFFRYAADDPRVLNDPRLVDDRGRGERALDAWGEVRTPEAMAEMAAKWHDRWGFTHHKLKAGVLPPEVEVDALRAINERFEGRHPLRIDPNGRWTTETAVRIGREIRDLPLEYYEDPVRGQNAMAEVRRRTGLKMSTNSCLTSFEDVADAVMNRCVDIVLCDHHYWGGIPACQGLGTLADAVGWSLSQHSNNHAGVTMAAMIHVGALIPQLTHPSDTHYPWLPEGADIIEGANLAIRNGRMPVPTTPGVGVELDQDKVARAHEVYEKCGMRGRDDAETMRRFEPGWERTAF